MKRYLFKLLFFILIIYSGLAMAEEFQHYELTLSDHRFEPDELTVPANTQITLTVHNQDGSYEEFHSDSLGREKIIAPNKDGIINLGPLSPGIYQFMGEFHLQTAQGRIIVK